MRLATKTKSLALIALLLGGLNWFDLGMASRDLQSLPELKAMTKDEILRFEITNQQGKIALEKEGESWMIRSPIQAKADQARVKSLLLNFRKSISMPISCEP